MTTIMRRGTDTKVGQAGYCQKCRTYMPGGPDVCLGLLPGVRYACCGHGEARDAYVAFEGEDGERPSTLREKEAIDYFDRKAFLG